MKCYLKYVKEWMARWPDNVTRIISAFGSSALIIAINYQVVSHNTEIQKFNSIETYLCFLVIAGVISLYIVTVMMEAFVDYFFEINWGFWDQHFEGSTKWTAKIFKALVLREYLAKKN